MRSPRQARIKGRNMSAIKPTGTKGASLTIEVVRSRAELCRARDSGLAKLP